MNKLLCFVFFLVSAIFPILGEQTNTNNVIFGKLPEIKSASVTNNSDGTQTVTIRWQWTGLSDFIHIEQSESLAGPWRKVGAAQRPENWTSPPPYNHGVAVIECPINTLGFFRIVPVSLLGTSGGDPRQHIRP